MAEKNNLLSEERVEYYRLKKEKNHVDNEINQSLANDALFIMNYGMDAYIKLYPDAIDNSAKWHDDILKTMIRLRKSEMADFLVGVELAVSAAIDSKTSSKFKKFISELKM